MKDQNCAYCVEGELLDAFGIKICELESSKVYLFKEQSHLGRVIVAHKKHVSELVELSQEELHLYFDEVAKVFAMNPGEKYLTEQEYAELVEKIKNEL